MTPRSLPFPPAPSQPGLNIGFENTQGEKMAKKKKKVRSYARVDVSTPCFVLMRKGMSHSLTQAVLPPV